MPENTGFSKKHKQLVNNLSRKCCGFCGNILKRGKYQRFKDVDKYVDIVYKIYYKQEYYHGN